jgi:monovalent cation:H+ antiporter-2, CPA2 family
MVISSGIFPYETIKFTQQFLNLPDQKILMLHMPHLINDLAILLIIAALVTFIFKLINQPVVLGYIIAGFLVSPNFSLTPTITDSETIKIWAEIGVIFLLFGLGLEFSFKKLKEVGGPASITGIVEVLFMLTAGYMTGKLLGWNDMDSMFLGGILSISSTTIIIRAFDELGVKSQHFATVVFGVLIVEDLVAILLLVLLSTIALTQQFQGIELFNSSLKLIFFLSLWFIAGIFIIPSILRRSKKYLNNELLLIFALGLCLVMVVVATRVGFSAALGAFVMGSIFAETTEGKRIEHLIQPMKDFFGAIFFVSVGMLIDPKVLIEHWQSAIIISIVTIVGKILSSSIGSIISGQTVKNSVQTGFSLAQIGEFSFIIATLGLSLKVTSEFLYPLAVAVSVITTFTTPYLIKYSEPFAIGLEKRIPLKIKDLLQRYSSSTQAVSVSSEARVTLRNYLTKLTLLTIVLISITVMSKALTLNFLYQYFETKKVASTIAFMATLLASAPFVWALMKGRLTRKVIVFDSPRLVFLPFVLHLLRYIIVFGILAYQISIFLPAVLAVIFILAVSIFGFTWFSKNLGEVYEWFERTFVKNLNEGHSPKPSPKPKAESALTLLLPWEAHLATYEISPHAEYLGKTLESLAIRENYGVTIVLIERGNKRIKAPSKDEALFPYDKVSIIGTDEQLDRFWRFIQVAPKEDDEVIASNYGLKGCVLSDSSKFVGKSIRESGIREQTEGLVVGLQRNEERIINPDATMLLEIGDILWIVGNKTLLKDLA